MVGLAPLWGAALLVHLLQLQPHFQLQDLCRQLLLEADLTPPERSGNYLFPLSGAAYHLLFILATLCEKVNAATYLGMFSVAVSET